MELQTLTVNTRSEKGKGHMGRMRKQGSLPAVMYGGEGDPISVQMDLKAFDTILQMHRGDHAIMNLDFADASDQNTPVLVKNIQRHPIYEHMVHVDFQRIRLDEKIQTNAPIILVGRAKGLVAGGAVEQGERELQIECLALDVPEEITVDISELDVGDTLHVSDLTSLENITILTDDERTVASCYMPRVAAADEAEEGEEEEGAEGEAAEGEGEEGEKKAE